MMAGSSAPGIGLIGAMDKDSARQIKTICAFCPDLPARQAALEEMFPSALLSHGCCPQCLDRLLEELSARES